MAATTLLASSLASPRARARQFARPVRIGFTSAFPQFQQYWVKLLGDLGWTHERDYMFIDSGLPYGPVSEEAARRIVAMKPDVIVTVNTAYALAVHRLTKTTPIVMLTSGYPVQAGLASSLARPGKNVTGNTMYAGTNVWGKLLQLLQEAKPGTKRIGLLWDYLPPEFLHEEIELILKQLRADARALGVETQLVEVGRPEEAIAGMNALVASGVQAILATYGPVNLPQYTRIMELSIAARLPTIADIRPPAPINPYPLLIYGPVLSELLRQAAGYVDRILKGALPGELPIQQPTRFELIVSAKSAKAIGLELPPGLLLKADQVIE